MIVVDVASADDLTDAELLMLRALRYQTATGPIVDRLIVLGLAEWTPSEPGYHVARLTAAGREIAEND